MVGCFPNKFTPEEQKFKERMPGGKHKTCSLDLSTYYFRYETSGSQSMGRDPNWGCEMSQNGLR